MYRHWRYLGVMIVLVVGYGCGFKPMYSQNYPQQSAVIASLANIEVAPIEGRLGQIVYYGLQDRLNPTGTPSIPEYVLEVVLTQQEIPLGIEQDRSITRYKVILLGDYVLKYKATGALLDKGQVRIFGSYNRVESDYATYATKTDVFERMASEMSQELSTRTTATLMRR